MSFNVELKRIMRRNCNNKNVAYSVAILTQRLAGLDFAVNDDFFGPDHDDANVCPCSDDQGFLSLAFIRNTTR